MSNLPAWVGIVAAVLIVFVIALEGFGARAFEWLERRLSRKQKIAGAAVLLVLAVVIAARGLLQVYGN